MYFYWNDGPTLQDGLETDTSLHHSTVLESLNLSSALFICEHDGSFELSDEKHPLKEKDQRVRQAVIDLYGEAIRASLSVLSSSSTVSASNLVSLLIRCTCLQPIDQFPRFPLNLHPHSFIAVFFSKKRLLHPRWTSPFCRQFVAGFSRLSKTVPLCLCNCYNLSSLSIMQYPFPLALDYSLYGQHYMLMNYQLVSARQ